MLPIVYQTLESIKSQSSGRGVSYWSLAATCGRKARLAQVYAEQYQDDLVETEDDKLSALKIGAYYHVLLQHWHEGRMPLDKIHDYDVMMNNPEFEEAYRLFLFYRSTYSHDSWGKVVATELLVPATDAGKQIVFDFFGEETTGRLDMLVELSQDDVDRINTELNLKLPAPGLYIIDHKTGARKNPRDYWEFTFGLQSILYQHIWNIENPDRQVQGMVFLKVVRHKKLTKDSICAFLATPYEGDEEVIRSLVRKGRRALDADEANPAACFTGYKPCFFFTNGMCDRK